jgi:hypothetical protein
MDTRFRYSIGPTLPLLDPVREAGAGDSLFPPACSSPPSDALAHCGAFPESGASWARRKPAESGRETLIRLNWGSAAPSTLCASLGRAAPKVSTFPPFDPVREAVARTDNASSRSALIAPPTALRPRVAARSPMSGASWRAAEGGRETPSGPPGQCGPAANRLWTLGHEASFGRPSTDDTRRLPGSLSPPRIEVGDLGSSSNTGGSSATSCSPATSLGALSAYVTAGCLTPDQP